MLGVYHSEKRIFISWVGMYFSIISILTNNGWRLENITNYNFSSHFWGIRHWLGSWTIWVRVPTCFFELLLPTLTSKVLLKAYISFGSEVKWWRGLNRPALFASTEKTLNRFVVNSLCNKLYKTFHIVTDYIKVRYLYKASPGVFVSF